MIESQLDAHRRTLEEAEDAMRRKGMEQKDCEAQIEQRQERIQKFRVQQMSCKSNADYKAFDHQIETVQAEIREVEERELVLMEELEELAAVRDEKQAALKEESAGVEAELQKFAVRTEQIQAELESTKADRAKAAALVDPDWLSRYDRIFAHMGDLALVTVEHNTCGGCHMKLPPQMAHDARRLDSMTACMYCGRLLYYIP